MSDPAGRFGWDALAPLLGGATPGVAFRIPLDAEYNLVGFCDDDGHAGGQALNFARWTADGDPVVGPVVLVREARDEDGWLSGLRDGDLGRVALLSVPGVPGARMLAAAFPRA